MNKQLFTIVVGRFIVALISLLSLRVITAFLEPAQYGEVALLLVIQSFCGLFLVSPIGQYINLNTHAWYDEGSLYSRLRDYVSYLLLVSLIGGVGVLVLYSGNINVLLVITTIFFLIFVTNWNSTLVPLLNMLGSRSESVFWSVVTSLISLFSSVCFVLYDPNALSWLAGHAIGMLVGMVGAYYSLLKRFPQKKQNKYKRLVSRKVVITYCLPLALTMGFMWLSQSGYRALIEFYWDLSALAFFVIAFQISAAVWAVVETISVQFLYPYFYKAASNYSNKEALENAYTSLLNILIPVYVGLAGVFICISPLLMRFLVSEKYYFAANYLLVAFTIELCRVLGNVISTAAHIKRKPHKLIFPYFVNSFLVLIGVFFIDQMSLDLKWVGIVLLIGSIGMLIVLSITMYNEIIFQIDKIFWFTAIFSLIVLLGISQFVSIDLDFWSSLIWLFIMIFPAGLILYFLGYKNPSLKSLTIFNLSK